VVPVGLNVFVQEGPATEAEGEVREGEVMTGVGEHVLAQHWVPNNETVRARSASIGLDMAGSPDASLYASLEGTGKRVLEAFK